MPRTVLLRSARALTSLVLLAVFVGLAPRAFGQTSRIYLANDDHTDYFWSGDDVEYRDVFLSMLDYYMQQAEDTESNPADSRGRFNCDGSYWVWEYEQNKSAAEFDRLVDHLRAGTITMPLHTLVELYGAMPTEAVLRNMYYAGRLERRHDLRFPLVSAIENQTMPAGVASLWAGSGAKYAWKGVCGCASNMDYGDRPREIYHFAGPDGASVCMKWNTLLGDNRSMGGYAEARYPYDVVDVIEGDPDFTSRWPWPVAGAFGYGWDALDSYTYNIINASLDLSDANRRVIVSNQVDFFEDFLANHGDEIETFSGSFGNEWDLLTATLAEVTADFRRTLEKLRTAEAMATVVSFDDPFFMSGREAARDAAFHACGLFYEHDWTANGPVGEAAREQFQRDQLQALHDYVDPLYDDALVALGSRVANPTGTERYVVFNPLSFERTDVAFLPIGAGGPFHVVDVLTGTQVPSQEAFIGGVRHAEILATGVPSVGYRVFEVRPGAGQNFPDAVTLSGATMDNGVYSVTLGSRGQIASLVDLTTAHEWAATDLFDIGTGNGSPEVLASGPVSATLRVDAGGSPAHETRVTLFHPSVDRVDMESRVTENFGGYVSQEFDFALSDFTLRHEEVGMIATAKHAADGGDYADEKVRVDYLTANHFVDLSETGRGITLSNWDSSFFKFGNSSIPSIDTSTPRVEMIVGMRPIGNLGITSQGGDDFFLNRYALRTHGGFDGSEAMAFSLAHQNPLVATPVTGAPTASFDPRKASFFQDSSDDVLLWTLKPSEEGIQEGVIARYWNADDAVRVLTSAPGAPFYVDSATATTHIETDETPLPVILGTVTMTFQPQQIRTVRYRLRDLLADTAETVPSSARLHLSAFPHPVSLSGTASLRLELSGTERVHLAVFDAVGRKVADVVDESMEAGTHILPWAPRSLHPGVYFGRAEAGGRQASTKIVVVR
ncbi:MAG: glycoside hydrolase [Candidatus Eisenbacteria bacterium]